MTKDAIILPCLFRRKVCYVGAGKEHFSFGAVTVTVT